MSGNNEKDAPVAFFGDSSSEDRQMLGDSDEKILSLARQYTNRSSISVEKGEAAVTDSPQDAGSDNFGRRLSRTITNTLARIDTNVNPFIEPADPVLDPFSEKFNARAWTRHVVRYKDRDPERYPHRTTGVSFKNLSAFGYGTGTDYQKTVANAPLQLAGIFRGLSGQKGEKVHILREFDGLVKAGESCVVLGRPGR